MANEEVEIACSNFDWILGYCGSFFHSNRIEYVNPEKATAPQSDGLHYMAIKLTDPTLGKDDFVSGFVKYCARKTKEAELRATFLENDALLVA